MTEGFTWQALNALVFFFRDVCGRDEVDLQVRLRKTARRQPVILSRDEVMRMVGKIEPRYRTPALLQYGAGLRLQELLELRIKDGDLERGTVTVRGGKGDKDRLTVLPDTLKPALRIEIGKARQAWEEDRANGTPGVALPAALARKMPRAGEKWAWMWLFPDDHLSTDPESGIVRRHHLHPKVYGEAVKRAAEAADIGKRVTTHALRHAFDSRAPPARSPLRGTSRSLLSKTPASLRRCCHPPARKRHRHPDGAGTARPCGCEDDRDLHARRGGSERLRGAKSLGPDDGGAVTLRGIVD